MAKPTVTFKNVQVKAKWTEITGEGEDAKEEAKNEYVEVGRLLAWFIQRTAFRGAGRPEAD